jgi:hypothetical protein
MKLYTAPTLSVFLGLLVALCVAMVSLKNPSQSFGYFSAHSTASTTWVAGDWSAPAVTFQVASSDVRTIITELVEDFSSGTSASQEVVLRPLSSIEVALFAQNPDNSLTTRESSWLYLELEISRESAFYVEPVLRVSDAHGVLLERTIPNEGTQVVSFFLPLRHTATELLQERYVRVEVVSEHFATAGFSTRILAATTKAASYNSQKASIFVLANDRSSSTVVCMLADGTSVPLAAVTAQGAQLLNLLTGRFRVTCHASDSFGNQSSEHAIIVENNSVLAESSLPLRMINERDGEWLLLSKAAALSDPWYQRRYTHVSNEGYESSLSAEPFLPKTISSSPAADAIDGTIEKSLTHHYAFGEHSVALFSVPSQTAGQLRVQTQDASGNSQETLFQILPGYPNRLESVLISEVMWMGSPLSSMDEWIELHNTSAEAVDLSAWEVRGLGAAGSSYFIPQGTVLPPLEHLVIARYQPGSASTLLAYLTRWLSGSISIANSNESLKLVTADGVMVDEVTFAKWPAGSNALPKRSMQRISFLSNGSDSASWYSCDSLACEAVQSTFWSQAGVFGTPGAVNR